MRWLATALTLLLVTACDNQVTPSQDKMTQLFHADPVVDARLAYADGQLSFKAVHNHHLILPMNIPECLVEKLGYETLSNQDFPYAEYEYQKYGAMAQIYANWYNFSLYEKLQVDELDDC